MESETAKDMTRLKATFRTPRDAVAYIIDTFPIVRRKDEEKWGEYRTRRVILEIYDQMAEAVRTGVPYQTVLDHPRLIPAWPTHRERVSNHEERESSHRQRRSEVLTSTNCHGAIPRPIHRGWENPEEEAWLTPGRQVHVSRVAPRLPSMQPILARVRSQKGVILIQP